MSLLFPRSSFGPTRHELGPFFNLFNDTFNELQKISESATRTFTPKFDVKEAKDAYTLEGELAGIDQKDIAIEFTDEQTLTIKGHSEHSRETGEHPAESEAVEVEKQVDQSKTSDNKEVATTGATEVAKSEPQYTYWVSERSTGEFMRSFSFPTRVDQNNIKASFKNGILSVVVPKLAKQNLNKRISIEWGNLNIQKRVAQY